MSHLSDKELDRLSREAAEQNDVEQNTSGWDSLHLRLEKEMPVNPRKQRRRLLLLLSLLVLLTGSGLVYQYVNGPSPAIDTISGTGTQSGTPGIPPHVPAVAENITDQNNTKQLKEVATPEMENNKAATAPPGNGQKESVSHRQQSANVNGTDKKTSAAEKTKPAITGSANNPEKSIAGKGDKPGTGEDNSTINRLDEHISAQQKNSTGKKVTATGGRISNVVSDERSKPAEQGYTNTRSDKTNTIGDEPAASVVSMYDATLISISTPAIDKKNIEPVHATNETPVAKAKNNQEGRIGKKFPFSIAITGGTDWTSVRFTHNDKAGYNAGIMLSWHFGKRFSLSTGAIYTKKNYSAYGKDYHPPKGYWTNYITVDELNGSCWMIDIPLNFRYDFAGGKQFTFFGSAGVSTYLMNKESYTYHYMYNGNYVRRNWLNENNSSHVLSILNVSGGYEKSVGKKISIQVEPYLKIPLSGIGFGKMQMNSYGINFAIRFRPEYKKQHTTVPAIHP